jgi:protein associated with RNAse G/E
MVNDRLTNFRAKISKKDLSDDSFDLGQWYTLKRLRHLNREISSDVPSVRKMTEPWAIVARFLLSDGICSSYPNIDPDTLSEFRFYVEKSRDNLGFYEIEDVDLEITSLIAAEVLENPTLNLVEWYRNELEEGDLYNNAYSKSILQNMKQCDSPNTSDSEMSEFSDAESVLSVLLDMFDEELDQDADVDSLPDLQPVSDTDSDCESQTAPEGGSYSNFEPSLANLEPNSLEAGSNEVESGSVSDDSGSSLGDLTGYELGKVGDILAWKAKLVLISCQPFPGDEAEALPMEFPNGKPRFEVTRGLEFPDDDMYIINDHARGIVTAIHIARLRHDTFSIGKWYAEICARKDIDHRPALVQDWMQQREYYETIMGNVREQYTAHLLEMACPFAHEDDDVDRPDERFDIQIDCHDIMHLVINDKFRQVVSYLPRELIEDPEFDLVNWYEFRLAQFELDQFDFIEEKVRDVATDPSAWPTNMEYNSGNVVHCA